MELKKTSALVKVLLEEDERCRNSDSYLYLKVISAIAEKAEIDLRLVTVTNFLMYLHGTYFPPFETVRRTRQKVQELNPNLRPSESVANFRKEAEAEYLAFVRCDV